MSEVSVDVQPTPNPNSMKFTLSETVMPQGSKTYPSKEAAQESPLAHAIFTVEGVASVFMLGDFITVTKANEADWMDVGPAVAKAIEAHYANA